jgi:hypothetical protein
MSFQKATAPAGDRGGNKDDRQAGRRDGHQSNRLRSKLQSRFRCLADAVAWGDEQARRMVRICRCPYCTELLILPDQPVAMRLPEPEECDE